jgi:hypothetical protein
VRISLVLSDLHLAEETCIDVSNLMNAYQITVDMFRFS